MVTSNVWGQKGHFLICLFDAWKKDLDIFPQMVVFHGDLPWIESVKKHATDGGPYSRT